MEDMKGDHGYYGMYLRQEKKIRDPVYTYIVNLEGELIDAIPSYSDKPEIVIKHLNSYEPRILTERQLNEIVMHLEGQRRHRDYLKLKEIEDQETDWNYHSSVNSIKDILND